MIASTLGAGCVSRPTPQSPTPPPTAPTRASTPAHAVSAVVLVNGCARPGIANAKLAEAAINQLVDGCGSFSGGRVRFTATLLPGGAIEFHPQADQTQAIPICVLSHPLTHKVRLRKACSLDVQLEEGAMSVPTSDGGP
ncbi:MAG: hypothetical protein ACREJ3_02415 [Polyangiaceae bacterium]